MEISLEKFLTNEKAAAHRQACTTTMSLFLWALWRTVSWTSPRGNWPSAEPLWRRQWGGGGRKGRGGGENNSRSASAPH